MNSRVFHLISAVIFIASVAIYKLACYINQQETYAQVIVEVEKRIALDLPRLNLSNSFLKHSGNSAAIKGYIERLNHLIQNESIWVNSIGDTAVTLEPSDGITIMQRELLASDRNVSIIFYADSQFWSLYDAAILLVLAMFAVGFGYWAYIINQSQLGVIKAGKAAEQNSVPTPVILIIDLNTKTLTNSHNEGSSVALANKPLCFYLALIEFCVEHPTITLNQNKDVPDELIELANKYFYRLTQLGHTIRKRPNFTNSLEKTLSEIRAALDELLIDHPELKDIYYPPKAHGEGSRSRLHSYGLSNIKVSDIEVIGK